MKYKIQKKIRRVPGRVIIFSLSLLSLLVIISIFAGKIYYNDLKAVSNNQLPKKVIIKRGDSVKIIAKLLVNDHLIRSSWAFDVYVHTLNNSSLQAGTYLLSSNQDVQSIVKTLIDGKIATKLVTILPGYSINQISGDLVADGFSASSVSQALNPALYSNLPVIAFKPKSVNTLEGLLWPDSFLKDSNTSPSTIIRESLIEMGQHLTPSLQAAFAKEGLSVYDALILASIVNQEVSKPSDQAQVAQVFLSRLANNMPLGSDVTALYGAIHNNVAPSLSYNSSYNTLLHTGLPPTPIATFSNSALQAVAYPAKTNWLYFVTGDNGVTYFSKTLAQQQANTALYCHKLCQSP